MFKIHKILGLSFMLAAFFASGAKADIIFVDPGTPGSGAQDFFIASTTGVLIDILFLDNKTLEWEAGTHTWLTPGTPVDLLYSGFLLDESGNEIPGTELIGRTQGQNDPIPLGTIDLSESTVFGGIRLTSVYGENVELNWQWDNDDRPLVGEPVPVELQSFSID